MTNPCPKLTSMPNIEEQATSIFTREVFNLVKGEIQKGDRYSCSKSEIVPNYDLFLVSKYTNNHPKRKVFISYDEEDIRCNCYWFETKEIPCRHIFASMKHSNKGNFPASLINSRWMKDAKDIDPKSVGKERRCPHPNAVQNTRYGRINTQTSLVSYYATKSQRAFTKAMSVMSTLVEDLQNMTNNEDDDDGNEDFRLTIQINDPKVEANKGRPTKSQSSQRLFAESGSKIKELSKPRLCKTCICTGHNSRSCPHKQDGGEESSKGQKS
ncbi:hypothetical protein CsatB_014512 [Cannabis sativa]